MTAAQTLKSLAAMTAADWFRFPTMQDAVRAAQASDEAECPFCSEPFAITERRVGMVWGVCYQCAEPVAVDVYDEDQ